ncbi:hypothetical protein GJ744_012301 [Endocarpon pusillum]|uniref:Peptidase C14 caspase domain-containing protein n=1 Tax=Endocarpon pusillum TaxID=364733 RepID=A0A8H7ADG7_9EURO|nr:hypothetical protein GJ744_012301 [Endocarpon pusillum]
MASRGSSTEQSTSAAGRQEEGPNTDPSLPNHAYCHQPMGSECVEERHSLQRDDARLKAVWSKEMGDAGERSVYRTVSVLLISWDDEAGDLKTEEEVQKLTHVLKDRYHFDVDDKRLNVEKSAQIQLNQHLGNFVGDKHDECGLLIIYYAGHGFPGNAGELTLTGNRNPAHHDSEKKKRLNEIVWHRAENLIRDSLGDVLVIFDCCAAGNLGRDITVRGPWPRRTFEFLGATSAGTTTPEPGPSSFTTALIWAFEQLSTVEGFTTSELLQKTTQAPNFPPMQVPVHHDRDKPSLRKIVISPLLRDQKAQTEIAAKESNTPAVRLEFLDLRMLLSCHPTEENITEIARTLKDMLKTKSLSIARHIEWGKLSAIEGSAVSFPNVVRSVSYIKRWSRRRSETANKNGLKAEEHCNGRISSSTPSVTSPPSPGPHRKRRRGQ